MNSKSREETSAALPSMRRSLVLSFAQKYTSLLFILPTIIIVSRLLTPAQIGVYSVAQASLLLVHMLRDFGVSDYLVQAHELNEDKTRTAFVFTLCIAWVLAGLLYVSSPWIGAFFGEPALADVLRVLSITFVLLPFCSTTNALLQRGLQFGIMYKIRVAAQAADSMLTIALAALGFGAMGLAWGSVVGMVATILGCFVWGRAYVITGVSLKHWRSVVHFGAQRTFSGFFQRIGMAAPDFVIGRMLGLAQVGFYSRGYGLVNMFNVNVIGAIATVAFPAYARDHREANNAHLLFLKATTYVTGVSWPFFAFAALMAFPVIRITFGPQWDAAAPILRLLAIAAFISTSTIGFAHFFVATGKVSLVTRATVIVETVRISVLIFAALYGLYAVAAAQILVSLVMVLLYVFLIARHSAVMLGDLWTALRPSLGVTVTTMIGPLGVYVMIPPSEGNLWMPTLLAGSGACVGWLIGARLIGHPLWSELQNALYRYRRYRVSGTVGRGT